MIESENGRVRITGTISEMASDLTCAIASVKRNLCERLSERDAISFLNVVFLTGIDDAFMRQDEETNEDEKFADAPFEYIRREHNNTPGRTSD